MRGKWDPKDSQFVKPIGISCLAVLYYKIPSHAAENFATKVQEKAGNIGLNIGSLKGCELKDADINKGSLETIIKNLQKTENADYVLAIADGTHFHKILKSTEISTKLPTQQIETKTVHKTKSANIVLSNIIQKLNKKGGGYNRKLKQAALPQVNVQKIDLFQSFLQDTMVQGCAFG
uniref:Piwi domain-containing protein n=1 Tax=Panagrolaimus davidi TaxID=227884 RepID=A0A914PIP4_9BILA